MTDDRDALEFDDVVALALAHAAAAHGGAPRPEVRERILAAIREPAVPNGFRFHDAADAEWRDHPVPGIRMKVLALNTASNYATLLLDVAPGTTFPAHRHTGAEECYVLSGSVYTCGRRMNAGDFLHADANTDHGQLWTGEGCRVLLVVPPEDYMTAPAHG